MFSICNLFQKIKISVYVCYIDYKNKSKFTINYIFFLQFEENLFFGISLFRERLRTLQIYLTLFSYTLFPY